MLLHTLYSPHLALLDYHVFRFVQNALNDKIFTDNEDIKSSLKLFFVKKDKNFFEREIIKLPEK